MKAVLLAGGFGSRLEQGATRYSGPNFQQVKDWIIGRSKGLIPINGKPIVEYQLEQILQTGIKTKDVYIHSNEAHKADYILWAIRNNIPPQNVISNGVTDNLNRLEQVKDMILAIEHIGTHTPLLMFACDTLVYGEDGNVYDFNNMCTTYGADNQPRVVVYVKGYDLQKHGVVNVDQQGNVVGFEEKPEHPISNLCNASIYLYSPEKLEEIIKRKSELLAVKNPLQVIWPNFKVEVVSHRVDIGSIEDVLKINNIH